MTAREVLAYAITHAPRGQKGGPYEADDEGTWGTATPSLRPGHAVRWRTRPTQERVDGVLRHVREVHPHARVIRIVRARPSPCPVHADQEHGREAEELRRGIEKILADALPAWDYIEQGDRDDDVICARDLKRLVDRVDARDSVAYLERKTRPSEAERAAQVEAIMPTQQPSEASAVEVLRELVAYDNVGFAYDSEPGGKRFGAIVDRARVVLASAGPDPSEVVRAAMAWGLACKRYGGRPLDLEIKTLEAVDAYRKAGGK